MATTPTIDAYVILRGSDGGYYVQPREFDHGMSRSISFASSTIDEALRYIRQKLEPGR